MRWKPWMTGLGGLAVGAAVVALLPRHTLFAPTAAPVETAAVSGERWACPMMDFISLKPGKCPVCGMTMHKVTAGQLTREQQRRMGVTLAQVTEGPAVATVRAYGAVRYDDRTLQVVVPRVAGRIVKRHAAALHPGTHVKAGDPVVDLYSPEAYAVQAELAAAIALRDQPSIHALTERLQRWNLGHLAQAIVDGKLTTDTLTITSPFDGLVVLNVETDGEMKDVRLPQVGQEIMADTPLIRLVEPRAFMLVVHVPETRAHWLRVGQPVQLESDDLGQLADLPAAITWVAPELNLELRAREVHIHLSDPSGRLLVGSLINARIHAALGPDLRIAEEPDAPARFTLVPKAAVLSTGVRHVAWRVAGRETDGSLRFELASLALGPRIEDEHGNDLYIVRSGLKPGDEVATQGAFLIDSQAQLAGTSSLLFPAGAVGPAPTSTHQH